MTECQHVWVKLLGHATMHRCSQCEVLGHGRAPGIGGSRRKGPDEIVLYRCTYCGDPAVVRGLHVSYCERHRNGKPPRLTLECSECKRRKTAPVSGRVEDPLTGLKFDVCALAPRCKCGGNWMYVR